MFINLSFNKKTKIMLVLGQDKSLMLPRAGIQEKFYSADVILTARFNATPYGR
jgi:hypothetical protein